jgi:hypothetical protein
MSVMILNENEVCPYSSKCVYNNTGGCYGARSDRNNKYTCSVVDTRESGGAFKAPADQTGKMQVIMD